MFNKVYHLRRTKMTVYQIAMILCVVSESVGTAALSGMDLSLLNNVSITSSLLMLQPDYVDQQNSIKGRSGHRAHVHNDDFVGIASYNIFVGIAVATIFGSGFFFDLFWPERYESPAVKLAWKICSVVVSFMALADAIAMTVGTPFFGRHGTIADGPPNRSLLLLEKHTLQVFHIKKDSHCSAKMVHQLKGTDITPNAWHQWSSYGLV